MLNVWCGPQYRLHVTKRDERIFLPMCGARVTCMLTVAAWGCHSITLGIAMQGHIAEKKQAKRRRSGHRSSSGDAASSLHACSSHNSTELQFTTVFVVLWPTLYVYRRMAACQALFLSELQLLLYLWMPFAYQRFWSGWRQRSLPCHVVMSSEQRCPPMTVLACK